MDLGYAAPTSQSLSLSTNESWPPLRHNSSLSRFMINFLSALTVNQARHRASQLSGGLSVGWLVQHMNLLATVLLEQPTRSTARLDLVAHK